MQQALLLAIAGLGDVLGISCGRPLLAPPVASVLPPTGPVGIASQGFFGIAAQHSGGRLDMGSGGHCATMVGSTTSVYST